MVIYEKQLFKIASHINKVFEKLNYLNTKNIAYNSKDFLHDTPY